MAEYLHELGPEVLVQQNVTPDQREPLVPPQLVRLPPLQQNPPTINFCQPALTPSMPIVCVSEFCPQQPLEFGDAIVAAVGAGPESDVTVVVSVACVRSAMSS
ncbi:MAG: hypothetical protein ACP5H2_08985 [Solirubrobacteraceae bacterium]